jgi:uncharacterized membrane protein
MGYFYLVLTVAVSVFLDAGKAAFAAQAPAQVAGLPWDQFYALASAFIFALVVIAICSWMFGRATYSVVRPFVFMLIGLLVLVAFLPATSALVWQQYAPSITARVGTPTYVLEAGCLSLLLGIVGFFSPARQV